MPPGSHRRNLPPWDRTLDATYHTPTPPAPPSTTFSSSLTTFFSSTHHPRPLTGYFRLPDPIRLLITTYLLLPSSKPVRLNPRSFTRDVWRDSDFQAPSDALEGVRRYGGVSFAWRADVLMAVLGGRVWHVTLGPFVGATLCPMATLWLEKYGMYMQNIVIEVDMSRLGYGPNFEATRLRMSTSHVEALLQDFVTSQLRRDESRPLDSLIILCRRFYGERTPSKRTTSLTEPPERTSSQLRRSDTMKNNLPSRPSTEPRTASPALSLHHSTSAPTPPRALTTPSSEHWPASPLSLTQDLSYCPDAELVVCNHLVRLRHRVRSLRMCGFSEVYTMRFVATLFPGARGERAYRVAPVTVWPRLKGQKAWVDGGDGVVVLDEHERQIVTPMELVRWEGCVQLPPPILNEQGTPSLPPIVEALQRLRSRSIGQSAKTSEESSLSSQILSVPALPTQSTSDRRKIKNLLERYGKTGARRKRTLTREVATTL